jgi:hypothetical protein
MTAPTTAAPRPAASGAPDPTAAGGPSSLPSVLDPVERRSRSHLGDLAGDTMVFAGRHVQHIRQIP